MNIITLITDWNENNFYSGAFKAKLSQSLKNEFSLMEITHSIKSFSYSHASYVLKTTNKYFPSGTHHIISVNDVNGLEKGFLAIEHKGQYYYCADNGIPCLAFDNYAEKIIRIEKFTSKSKTFPSLDVLLESVIFSIENKGIDGLGTQIYEFSDLRIPLMPTVDKDKIIGQISFIDSYKNAVTNISRSLFEENLKGRKFSIKAATLKYEIDKISESYNDVRPGDLVAVFNSDGLLELAQNEGNFAEIFGLSTSSTIVINFF